LLDTGVFIHSEFAESPKGDVMQTVRWGDSRVPQVPRRVVRR